MWVGLASKIYMFTPAAAVAVTSSHRQAWKLGLLLHSRWLVKRMSSILFVLWVSESVKFWFLKHKGIRAEITVKSIVIYKSDLLECKRNMLLNIREKMNSGKPAWILSWTQFNGYLWINGLVRHQAEAETLLPSVGPLALQPTFPSAEQRASLCWSWARWHLSRCSNLQYQWLVQRDSHFIFFSSLVYFNKAFTWNWESW